MIRTKSCRCVMLRVTSLWIRLTILETYNYFHLNIHIELSPLPHSHRTYTPNKVISLGLQTLNPQQNYFPLKTQTSDYHYPETSKSHTNLCRNSEKHRVNTIETTTILHETRVEIFISRVNHRYIAFDNN